MIDFEPASFKDPAGRVFYHRDLVCRTLTPAALEQFRAAERSGLIKDLIDARLLIDSAIGSSADLGLERGGDSGGGAGVGEHVLQQRRVAVVSYSYEWSFEMLRAAALATLAVMDRALAQGFVLKDANAFNVLFDDVRPVLVDAPSIEPYVEGRVWAGYNQFCRSFLFPLLIAAYRGIDVRPLLQGTLGEIPVSVASKFFGLRDLSRGGVLKDVVLQARLERSFGRSAHAVKGATSGAQYPKALLVNNVRRLRGLIDKLPSPSARTDWSHYEDECNYSAEDQASKEAFVGRALAARPHRQVVDLGCNTGGYTRLPLMSGARVIAIDLDATAIDELYRRASAADRVSPMVANLLHPTPAMGWRLEERRSLLSRISSDAFLALALVHHLRITGGVPLASVVGQLFAIAPEGVVEWVDKSDSQVQRMLALRPDVYDDYTWPSFEALLAKHGEIVSVETTHGGARRLCHVRAR